MSTETNPEKQAALDSLRAHLAAKGHDHAQFTDTQLIEMIREEVESPTQPKTKPLPQGESYMNDHQKAVLIIGALLIVGMALLPPWQRRVDNNGVHRTDQMGYGLIFDPPRADGMYYSVSIDLTRLLVQCAAAAVLTGVGFALTRKKPVH